MLEIIANKYFIEFLDLVVKVQEFRFDNPDLSKAFKLSKKDHLLKAQPIFLNVINQFNLLSERTIELFKMELDILYDKNLLDVIKHIINDVKLKNDGFHSLYH